MSPGIASVFPAAVTFGRPAIRAHDSLLRVGVACPLSSGPRRHGLRRRILDPRARHDHRPPATEGGLMSKSPDVTLITSGLAASGRLGTRRGREPGRRYGLIPPDGGGLYGAGETLTYAAQRLLTRHSLAREFGRSQISKPPFANGVDPLGDDFQRLRRRGSRTGAWPSMAWSRGRRRSRSRSSGAFPGAARSRIWRAKRAGRTSPNGAACRWRTSWTLRGRSSPGSLRCLPFVSARLVGEHRHGRCLAPADSGRSRYERR